jgi:excinuclease UvrABC nuclease subunit
MKGHWIKFTKENRKLVPNYLGVYQLANANKELVYIGRGQMHTRLTVHARHKAGIAYFRYLQMPSDIRCRQKERALTNAFVKKYNRLPLYNLQIGAID